MADMLEAYLAEHGIEAELIESDRSTESARDAAKALDTSIDRIIKSLVFYADGEPVLVVVRGPDRAAPEKIAATLDADAVEMASPDAVTDETGYRVGTVPPVGTGLRKIVDDAVLANDTVYGGGGAEQRMLKLDPRFLVGEHDMVADVTEA